MYVVADKECKLIRASFQCTTADAKSTPSYSLDLHFSILNCHCWTYDDNVSPELKNLWFVILGADNMLDGYRPEVCQK